MSGKRMAQPAKVFSKDTQESLSNKIDQISDERVRILQDNLVFVTALPSEVANKDKLSSVLYFSRYGPISKLIMNPPFPTKKTANLQAYVTYNTELDASLAIVALDGYKLSDRPLKVSFGTTKYCSHFLKGNECPNAECFYLHKLDRTREVSSSDTRTIFKQQNSKAMETVVDNLQEIAARVLESDIEDIQDGFPSITQVLDYLVDNDYVAASQIDKAFQVARSKRRVVIEMPKLQTRVQSLADPREREKELPKLVKSNSHSTMSTPTKMIDQIVTSSKKKQQPKTQKKVQSKTQQKTKQTTGKQNQIGTRQLKLQQKIQKLIIKELLKKNNTDCRSRFVKGAVASKEECSRLRGIVQKYLITHN